jgi:hypothetical protein
MVTDFEAEFEKFATGLYEVNGAAAVRTGPIAVRRLATENADIDAGFQALLHCTALHRTSMAHAHFAKNEVAHGDRGKVRYPSE